MTEITLGGDRDVSKYASAIVIKMVTLSFMTLALLCSALMLNWAVADKVPSTMDGTEITAEVRERQLTCLARNIYYEAGNEPFEGKVAVAQVTINRAESDLFPNDICKVIYQKNKVYEKTVCQFSWYCDRATVVRPIHKEAYDESMEVAKKVLLEGFRLPSLQEAMFYHADYVNPGWKLTRITKVGRHIFYK
jgi:spore germination cell wall hydrolase CwlJ-like protein